MIDLDFKYKGLIEYLKEEIPFNPEITYQLNILRIDVFFLERLVFSFHEVL